MKKVAILFLIVSQWIVSCQKKQYAYFQSSSNHTFVVEKKAITPKREPNISTIQLSEIEKPIQVTASVNEELNVAFQTPAIKTSNELKEEKLILKKEEKKSLLENKVERAVARKMTKFTKMNHVNNGNGWNSLNSTLKLGILLILASILIGLIPFLGWLLGGIVGLIGVILLLWGILIQLS